MAAIAPARKLTVGTGFVHRTTAPNPRKLGSTVNVGPLASDGTPGAGRKPGTQRLAALVDTGIRWSVGDDK